MKKTGEKSIGKGSGDVRVLTCNCIHEYQDSRYGKGRRLHNPTEKLAPGATTVKLYRCTVCKTERKCS